jgi:c-di-AMP phosphodiesterase-like protein
LGFTCLKKMRIVFYVYALSFVMFILISYMVKRMCFKRFRANRYYVYSVRVSEDNDEEIILDNKPITILFYSDGKKFFKLREKAIEKIRKKYPQNKIVTITYTLQTYVEKVHNVQGEDLGRDFYTLLDSYYLTLCNLRNIHTKRWKEIFKKIEQRNKKKYQF